MLRPETVSTGAPGKAIQLIDRIIRQIEFGRGEILAQMRDRRSAGDKEDVR